MPENVMSIRSRILRLDEYLHPSLDQEHGISQCRWPARLVMIHDSALSNENLPPTAPLDAPATRDVHGT